MPGAEPLSVRQAAGREAKRAGEINEHWIGQALDMDSSRRQTARVVLFSATCVLILLAVFTSTLIIHRQNASDRVARSELTWEITQAVVEVAHLEAAIGGFVIDRTDDARDTVGLWLDLVFHRAAVLGQGDVWQFIRTQPEMVDAVRALQEATVAAEPLVAAIDRPGSPQSLLALLLPLNHKLTRMASMTFSRNTNLTSVEVASLGRLHWVFSGVLLLLILCSFGLIGVVLADNRLLSAVYRDMRSLVAELRGTAAHLSQANAVLSERDHELHARNTQFDAALRNMSQALCMVDAQERLIVCNARFIQMFSLDQEAIHPGTMYATVLTSMRAAGSFSRTGFESFRAELRTSVVGKRSRSFSHQDANGRTLSISLQMMAEGGWVATFEEISERRRAEARITYLAHHDPLTGLPNRLSFQTRLAELVAGVGAQSRRFALLCVDLDHFKAVNDTLGHPAGDMLLEAVAKRLRHCVREGDMIARLGGDEFAVLQRLGDEQQAAQLGQRIVDHLSLPYDLAGQRAMITASVGIAAAQAGSTNTEEIFQSADMALYEAKRLGRAGFRFFTEAMTLQLKGRRELEMDLREAVSGGKLEVYYQPIVDLRSGQRLGFEALSRWRHAVRGMISPGEFIPIAEEIGLIEQLGNWVLQRACADAASWPQPLRVAVNLSPLQFKGNLVESVTVALDRSGLPANRLELEVTESVLLLENDSAVTTLRQIRALGVHITLDDFGTGFSSLSYLRSFPFEKIKIDQSFVREMHSKPDCRTIISAITGLAHELGMRATAEGVENEWQLDQVRKAGCNEVQGFLYSRPMPSQDVSGYLEQALPENVSLQTA